LIKNSQPFGKKIQKTVGGIFLTHTVESYPGWSDLVRLRKKRAQYNAVVKFVPLLNADQQSF